MTYPPDTERQPESTREFEETRVVPNDVEPGRESRWTAMLGAVAMLAIGVAIGWLVFATPPDEAGDATTPSTTAEADDAAPSPGPEVGREPVAEVAESLLPSVVQIETRGGLGSGVIYDSNGLILTAAHVVDGSDQVQVRLSDGSQYPGEVVGGDRSADIAVVRIDGVRDLPAAPLALDSEVQVGELAVAIGSPFGLDSTVTSGVISAVNQAVGSPEGGFQSLIQTDAAINPGNSGGALANRQGEVVGINVSIFSRSGGNDGIGFAVPITTAVELAESIVSGEPIATAVLGVTGGPVQSGDSGALITGVQPGSGADEAGIQVGDVIQRIDDVRVNGIRELAAEVQAHRPGDEVDLVIRRRGETVELTVTLGSAR